MSIKHILLVSLAFGASSLAYADRIKIEDAAFNCLKESAMNNSRFSLRDVRGKPVRKDGALELEVRCEASNNPKVTDEYFFAASDLYEFRDEPFSDDQPDLIRRIFALDEKSGSSNNCVYRNYSRNQKVIVACYFNMAVPGVLKKAVE